MEDNASQTCQRGKTAGKYEKTDSVPCAPKFCKQRSLLPLTLVSKGEVQEQIPSRKSQESFGRTKERTTLGELPDGDASA